MYENKPESNKFEIELSLLDCLSIFVRNLWIIAVCAILCGTAVYMYNRNYVVPVYRAEVMFYIAPVSSNALSSDYNEAARLQLEVQSFSYAKQIKNTYLQIFQTRTFISKLSDDYYESYAKEMNGSVSPVGIADTDLFKMQVTSPSREDAYTIAKQIEKTAPEAIIEIIGNDTIRIADKAVMPQNQINNNIIRNTFMGIMFSSMSVYGIAFMVFIFDRRIKSEDDLKKRYNVPILGGIIDFSKTYKSRKEY